MKVLRIIGLVLLGIAAAAALGFLLGIAVMSLWNWLMPELFGLPEIGYWQAVGLFVLCHLLFKSHIEGSHDGKKKKDDDDECGSFAKRIKGFVNGEPKACEEEENPEEGLET